MTTAAHVSIKKVTPKVLEYVHSRFQYDSDLGRLISKIDSGNGRYSHNKGEIIKGEITLNNGSSLVSIKWESIV